MSVLTVVTGPSDAAPLARLGFHLARALEERLIILCLEDAAPEESPAEHEPIWVVPGKRMDDELPRTASEALSKVCLALERPGTPQELQAPDESAEADERILADPEIEVRRLKTSRQLQAVIKIVGEAEVRLLIAAHEKSTESSRDAPLARKLFTAAHCHTLLVHPGSSDGRSFERILVPTAGGPHAGIALSLAARLAQSEGGEVVPFYVQADEGELAREVGQRILDKAIVEAGITDPSCLQPRVVLGSDRFRAIGSEATEGFDLLILGESNAGTLRRSLFGTVPDHLLAGDEAMMVAVARREWKLLHRLRRSLGRWLDLTIPQMAREERTALYERLQSGSKWNFDFMALIALSTAIATLGLLQSSAAVVIGAMLVAPLMTPILGAGLALVQGNLPLLRTSGTAITFGYLMALLIGFALGRLFPVPELTPELLARGEPTLLDMGVALFSGIAAAYCLGRPGLLAALPGVAIAAALVPPIATTGVALALGATATAQGSALLFATNVVTIILGAAMSFYASGVRGRSGASSRQVWVRWMFLSLLLGAAVLTVPLGSLLFSKLSDQVPIPDGLESRLEERLKSYPGTRLIAVRRGTGQAIEISLSAPEPPSAELISSLSRLVKEDMGQDQSIRVATRLLAEVP